MEMCPKVFRRTCISDLLCGLNQSASPSTYFSQFMALVSTPDQMLTSSRDNDGISPHRPLLFLFLLSTI
jgi:hypothetical protein